MPPENSLYSLPREPVGTDKQAQGCAGEGLQPEELSPRLRARLLAVTCKNIPFGKYHLRPVAPVRKLQDSLLYKPAGTDKKAQGCAGGGLHPEGLSPRLRARLLAVTCKMSLLESII